MKKLVIMIFSLVLPCLLFVQSQRKEILKESSFRPDQAFLKISETPAYWAKIYKSSEFYFYITSLQETSEGGCIVAGEINKFNPRIEDFCIMKLNATGRVAWFKSYAGSGNDTPRGIQETSDGGYIVAGDTTSFGAGKEDIWVIKLDQSGLLQWQKAYGGTGEDIALFLEKTNDGGCIVAAASNSFGADPYDSDLWLLKLDPFGRIEWQKVYDRVGNSWGNSTIQQTNDGGYIVAYGGLLKLSASGEIEWARSYEVPYKYFGIHSARQTREGGYVAAGSAAVEQYDPDLYDYDNWIIKLDHMGNVQWKKRLSCYYGWEYPQFIRQTRDEGYILGVTRRWRCDAIFKLDPWGSVQWGKQYQKGYIEEIQLHDLQETRDGDYVISGFCLEPDPNPLLLLKVNSGGEISPDCSLIKTLNYSELDSPVSFKNISIAHNVTSAVPMDTDAVSQDRSIETEVLCSGSGTREYTLKISASAGGTTNPAPGSYALLEGTEAMIEAMPEPSFIFSHWSGDIKDSQKTANPMTVHMDADKSLQAHFLRKYALTISASAGGITDPAPGTYEFIEGTSVEVKAIPAAHYLFNGWTGDATEARRYDNPIRIMMDSDKSLQANFLRRIYAPLNLKGQKALNRSLMQAEYINVLTWESNPDNVDIAKYRIYQVEGLKEGLKAEVSAQTFSYWHRKVHKDIEYKYAVCAVNGEGREGERAYITVK